MLADMGKRGYLLTGVALVLATSFLVIVGAAISVGGDFGGALPLYLAGVLVAVGGLYFIIQALRRY
jgi:hypothetical protein